MEITIYRRSEKKIIKMYGRFAIRKKIENNNKWELLSVAGDLKWCSSGISISTNNVLNLLMPTIRISFKDVFPALSGLGIQKVYGPHGIPTVVLPC